MRVDGDALLLPLALYEGRKRPYNMRAGLRRAQNDLAGGECGATARAHGWRGSAKTPKSPKKTLYEARDAAHRNVWGVGGDAARAPTAREREGWAASHRSPAGSGIVIPDISTKMGKESG